MTIIDNELYTKIKREAKTSSLNAVVLAFMLKEIELTTEQVEEIRDSISYEAYCELSPTYV